MIKFLSLAIWVACVPSLPQCPVPQDGVVFCCGKAYACLDDVNVRETYEEKALEGAAAYAYALAIYHRSDRNDIASALPWITIAASSDFFHAKFERGEILIDQAIGVDKDTVLQSILPEMESLAEGNPILETRLGIALAESPKFRDRGLAWLERSALNGSVWAVEYLVNETAHEDELEAHKKWCGVAAGIGRSSGILDSSICSKVDDRKNADRLRDLELSQVVLERSEELDRRLADCQSSR